MQKTQRNAQHFVERVWVRPTLKEDVLNEVKNGNPERVWVRPTLKEDGEAGNPERVWVRPS